MYYHQALSTKKTELQSESQLQQNQVAGGSHSGRMVGVARMPNGDFLRASVRRSSIAPVPGVLSEEGSESFSGVDVSGCSATFPVFSVARGFARIRANAPRALEFFAFRLAQRRLRAAFDDLAQFLQIHIHSRTSHRCSNSRNLAFRGKPSICFAGRVCSEVGARCPRPAVVSIYLPVGRALTRSVKTRGR